jgi:hypothetical protein
VEQPFGDKEFVHQTAHEANRSQKLIALRKFHAGDHEEDYPEVATVARNGGVGRHSFF